MYLYSQLKRMIMNRLTLLLLSLTLIFSCSKDDSSPEETYEITGTFLTPNQLDPIADAKVTALRDNNVIETTLTNTKGEFKIQVPNGDYEIVLEKGKFTSTKTITVNSNPIALNNVKVDNLPNIAVITGAFDNIEYVLYNMGLLNPLTNEPLFDIVEGVDGTTKFAEHATNHKGRIASHSHLKSSVNNPNLDPNVSFDFGDLLADATLLNSYDMLFINCGIFVDLDATDIQNISNYVANGGLIYATDWSYSFILDVCNDNSTEPYISFYSPAKSGTSTSTNATILDGMLSNWLSINFGISIDDTVTIDDFLPSWQVVDTYNSADTTAWISGPVSYDDANGVEIFETKDLAFTFNYGNGGILYSSFHTHNHSESELTDVERILEFFVLELSDL